MPRTAYGLPSHASAIKFRSISPRKWKWIYPSFLPSVFPLNCLMALPQEYIYLFAFSSCRNSRPAFLARANIVHEHERATIFVIVRADRDKGGARRIAIKPPRSARLFSSCDSLVHCPDHRQPSSRRSTDIGPGSRWSYPIQSCLPHRNSRRNLHICAITKTTSPPPPISLYIYACVRIAVPLRFTYARELVLRESFAASLIPLLPPSSSDCLSPTRYLLLCKTARSA